MMKAWKFFGLIFLFHSAHCRHTVRISPRTGDANAETAQDTLKRLIQFYRSQDLGNRPSSGEGPESRELDLTPDLPTFRIDLSNGNARDDMVPFTDGVPMGSIEMAPVITIFPQSDEAPSQDSILPQPNEGEPQQPPPPSPPVVNPEEAESDVTTMFPIPMEVMANISQIGVVIQQDEKTTADDEINDEDEDEDEEGSSEEECKEGETKKLRCNNSCVCVDGAFFCSKRKCAGNPRPGNVTAAQNPKVGSGETPKKPWGFKKKDPNANPLPTCSSGLTKSIDCNQCICVMGKWACTKRGCIALTLREKASYTDGVSLYNQVETLTENKSFDEDCSEGGTRQMDCNQCICHLNSWSCSNFPCGPTPPPKKAPEILEACQKEGDVKTRGCNLCKCTHGTWMCSDNDCKAFEDKDMSIPAFRTSSKVNRKPKFQKLNL